MSPRLFGLTAAAALAFAFPAAAEADLSGFWVLQGDPMAVPAANSTPEARRQVEALMEARGLDAPNGSPEYARTWCTPFGVPWQMMSDQPIDISQGPISVSMTFNVENDQRHIYIDGQPHPDADVFDFTSVGHSIGHWEGDTLVASTVFFMNGIEVIPGGALRTGDSELVERIRLADHDTLQITSTWTDPTTLRGPHTYTYTYKRAPGPVWMIEPQCNPVRAMRQKGYFVPSDAKE